MTSGKIRVAVVFGGRSTEHGVSCVSARNVLSHIDRDRFDVIPVGITPDGAWVLGDHDPEALRTRGRTLPTVKAESAAVAIPGDPTRGGVVLLEPGQEGRVLSGVDVVFPVLHGAYGEDGTIQGLLEMAGIPYVGPGVLASAASMDKEYTKKLLTADGLPTGDHVVLRQGRTLTEEQRDWLGLPVFVKPARAGSSTGITKVESWSRVDAAIAEARRIDPKVLVEAMVVGAEVECGVLEFPDGRVEASVPARLRFTTEGRDWYDFDAKYLDDVCEFDIPAPLDPEMTDRVRELAVRAFRALDCQGLARVDFFATLEGDLLINEINTMPGFTPISMYPATWAATGVDYQSLITILIETALARGTGLR